MTTIQVGDIWSVKRLDNSRWESKEIIFEILTIDRQQGKFTSRVIQGGPINDSIHLLETKSYAGGPYFIQRLNNRKTKLGKILYK